ncbi:MAG: MgtC/SapB family protein [Xanthomonadales bacterium]|jgi:putative Mg2+ transporter-C (MgtC) family protein|nr:MgtC/SapB family protein [Xanthomonadales bacterium]
MDIAIDWDTVVSNTLLLGVAYLLALPIAFNREQASRSAGLRTYPMVALGACGLMLIGIKVMGGNDAEGRVMQAVITGMGFIGGGAILKGSGEVTGLATASSLWITGAIGIAVAWQRYEIAVLLSLLTFLTLTFVPSAKKMVNGEESGDGDA